MATYYLLKHVVPTSSFAMKHQEITYLPSSTVNYRRIYIKKIPLRQLTAAEQRISAINCSRISFLANLKVETSIILLVRVFLVAFESINVIQFKCESVSF